MRMCQKLVAKAESSVVRLNKAVLKKSRHLRLRRSERSPVKMPLTTKSREKPGPARMEYSVSER